MTTEKNWADLSPEERREERFNRWLSPAGVKFSGPEAEKGYKARVYRLIKVIKIEEPDRVPVMLPAGFFPAYYAGSTLKKVMYDYDELRRAWLKFLNDFELDTFDGQSLVLPGRMLDSLDHKLHLWPGHGLADNISLYQYIEGEYMKPEEYDAFIKDPSDFLLRTFLPRSVGAFRGFQRLGPLTPFIGIPVFYITQFGDPEVWAAVQALLDAALEGVKWRAAVMDISRAAREAGIPSVWGAMSGAPYDLIGDVLRGTKGIMMDMYQRPDKLQEAMERITSIVIDEAIGAANASGCPVVFMPLHKGTGGFMSSKQFETFYWPTLKKVMMGLIEEGLVPMPFAEGDYMPRLEIIKDMPKGKVIWYFEAMDMAKAKKVLGNHACIAGNLPVSLLCTGTPNQVKEGCRQLIETCAPGGGYILTGSASINEGNPNNLRAMMEAAKEYGVYK
jgi:uroporphyrinogen-III decarboxylase